MKINNIIKKLEKEGYEVDYINETVQVGDFDIMGFSRTFDIESILIFME